jgi:DNA-directed RNA polymerase specialized sigma24 family protein
MVASMVPHSSEDEKDDLVHQVFERMLRFKSLETFDPSRNSFGGWTWLVTRTVCVNFIRSVPRTPTSQRVLNPSFFERLDRQHDLILNGTCDTSKLDYAPEAWSVGPQQERALEALEVLEVLEDFAEDHENPKAVELLRLLADGGRGVDVAKDVGICESRVTWWRQQFKRESEAV